MRTISPTVARFSGRGRGTLRSPDHLAVIRWGTPHASRYDRLSLTQTHGAGAALRFTPARSPGHRYSSFSARLARPHRPPPVFPLARQCLACARCCACFRRTCIRGSCGRRLEAQVEQRGCASSSSFTRSAVRPQLGGVARHQIASSRLITFVRPGACGAPGERLRSASSGTPATSTSAPRLNHGDPAFAAPVALPCAPDGFFVTACRKSESTPPATLERTRTRASRGVDLTRASHACPLLQPNSPKAPVDRCAPPPGGAAMPC